VVAIAAVGGIAAIAAIAPAMAVGVSGCIIGDAGGDDGSAAAGDGGGQSVGDQCTAIATEWCTQAINRCAMAGFTLNDCVQNDLTMCCTGSVCSETSKSPASSIDTCKTAIDQVDCNYIANSTLPSECQGLPQKP